MTTDVASPPLTRTASITAPAESWTAALDATSPGIAARPPVPILAGVLIQPGTDQTMLSVYDYATSAQVPLQGAEFTGSGEPFLIGHKDLAAIIKTIVGKKKGVPVSVHRYPGELVVEGAGYSIPVEDTMPAREYPPLPAQTGHTILADAAALKAALARITITASTDEILPILTAVRVDVEPNGLYVWATDRYRLSTDFIPAVVDRPGQQFLLPVKAWTKIARWLTAGQVAIGYDEEARTIRITSGDVTYTTTAVDGDYPKIQALFPETVPFSVTADRAILVEAATVAQKLTARNLPCHLAVTARGATITKGRDDETKTKAAAPLAAGELITGGDFDEFGTGINPVYLLEMLRAIPTGKVTISVTSPAKPWLFTPEGVTSSDTDAYRHLIMPVRLAD